MYVFVCICVCVDLAAFFVHYILYGIMALIAVFFKEDSQVCMYVCVCIYVCMYMA